MTELCRPTLLKLAVTLLLVLMMSLTFAAPFSVVAVEDPRSLWNLSKISNTPLDLKTGPYGLTGRYQVEFTSEILEATGAPLRIFSVLTVPKGVDADNAAPAILLVHGYGGSSASMLSVADILAKQGHISLAIDRPGRGNSGGPAENYPNYVDVVPNPRNSYSYHSIVAMIRAVQYLSTRPDVKVGLNGKKLVGIVGVSHGGEYVLVHSCIDPNVQATVAIIASGSLDETQ